MFSQFGEDGILEKVLDLLPTTDKFCVEFGAHDGVSYSNSANLISSRNYRAVLIEPNNKRFAALAERYRNNSRITLLNRFVGFRPADNLDAILNPLDIPLDFDLLSIDIDGNDYHAWAAIEKYQPKVVVIEFNPTIPTGVDFVQPCDPKIKQGNSITALCRLASRKDYQLICVTSSNAIFVKSCYFSLFSIADNSPAALRIDTSAVTYIFHGYDGKFFISGHGYVKWHGIPLSGRRLQQLPVFLRGFPEDFGPMRMLAMRTYRWLRKRLPG